MESKAKAVDDRANLKAVSYLGSLESLDLKAVTHWTLDDDSYAQSASESLAMTRRRHELRSVINAPP